MRFHRSLAMTVFMIGMVEAQASVRPDVDLNPNSQMTVLMDEVLRLTNVERAAAGLKPLKLDPTLNRAAYWKAVDLSSAKVFDHKDTLGRSPKDRIESFGYTDWERLSENIAGGYLTAEEVVQAWMQSPGHRKNIMDGKVNEIGIAFYYDPNSRHGYYWVQNFARRAQ